MSSEVALGVPCSVPVIHNEIKWYNRLVVVKCNSGSGFREVIFLVLFEHLLRINIIPKEDCHLLQGFTFCFGEEKRDDDKVRCVQTHEQQVKFPSSVGHPNRRRLGNQYVEQPVRARGNARANGPRPGRKHL